jgi:hypothetical protein
MGPEDSPVDVPVAADRRMLAFLPRAIPRLADRVGVALALVDLGNPRRSVGSKRLHSPRSTTTEIGFERPLPLHEPTRRSLSRAMP